MNPNIETKIALLNELIENFEQLEEHSFSKQRLITILEDIKQNLEDSK